MAIVIMLIVDQTETGNKKACMDIVGSNNLALDQKGTLKEIPAFTEQRMSKRMTTYLILFLIL